MDEHPRAANSPTDRAVRPSDRREHKRYDVLRSAVVKGGRGHMECMVINLSLGGAKVMLMGTICLDPGVTLVIDEIGAFHADVVWQRQEFAGLRFTDPAAYLERTLGSILPD
jgi:hypothetical protein